MAEPPGKTNGWSSLELGLVAVIAAVAITGGVVVFLIAGRSSPTSTAAVPEGGGAIDSSVCAALRDFDRHRTSLDAYLRDVDRGDAQAVRQGHEQLLDAMLATAGRLFGGSADESQFSELELAIGDWMQATEAAMVMVDTGFRTGDRGFFDDAERDLGRAADAEATINRLRGEASC